MSLMKKPVILAMLLIFTCIFSVPGMNTPSKAMALTNPTVSTNDYDDVTEDSATLYGELIDAGSFDVDNITAYGIAYGTSYSTSAMTKKTVGTSGLSEDEEFDKTITGLNSGTKYYYRAFVKFSNSATYFYGSAKYFTTEDSSSDEKPEVTTAAADDIGDDYATLNGTIEATGDSDITSYGFYWGTSSSRSSMDKEEVGDDSDSMNDGDDFTFDLSDLDTDTKYYFQAYATNDAGTSYGTVKYFTTGSDSSDKPKVTTKAATDIGDDNATLNATLDSIGGDDITEYGFYYGTSSSPNTKKKVGTDISEDDDFDYTLTGLTADTKYYFKAYAKNSSGTSYGSVKYFTTDASTSKPVLTTDTPTISGNTAILKGKVTSSASSIKSYGFYYGTDSYCNNRILVGTSGLSEDETYTYNLSGLVSGATYYVKAYATNSAGTGYGVVRSFTMGSSTAISTFTIGSPYFSLNGVPQAMDAAPYIKNNRTYMPIRYVCYAMGMTDDNIQWNGGNIVTLTKGGTVVKLTIGSPVLVINGVSMLMDVAPETTNNRTCLPIAWVVKAFGYTAVWDGVNQKVTVR